MSHSASTHLDASGPLRGHRTGRGAFVDLAVVMVALGLVIGAIFPVVVIGLGIPATLALRPSFFAATLTAGLLLGCLNFVVARRVVGARMRVMAQRMRDVAEMIDDVAYTGDLSRCTPAECVLPADSPDEIGKAGAAFNRLIHALHEAWATEGALSQFSSAVAEHLTLTRVAETVVQGVVGCTGAVGAALLTIDGGELCLQAQEGLPAELATPEVVGDAIARPETSVVRPAAPTPPDGLPTADTVGALAVTPLRHGDAAIGVLVTGLPDAPVPNALRLLTVLGDTAAVAVGNAMTHARVQELAISDSLTGAYNRRFGRLRLEEEWSKSIRYDLPLGVVMLDLDRFKRINDVYGHHAGDRVLQQVGEAIRGAVRDHDVVFRSGGEEFVVVLPNSNVDNVTAVAERLRQRIAGVRVTINDGELRVTASLGGLSYPSSPAASVDDLLRRADAAQYQSKARGHDRVTIDSAASTVS